ncbi:MAG TPA: methionine--tRNA ligase [Gemmatimonadaceae bacterium]|nr:methionine--tRNA ligase [Gemmatimonadaceae bacterium]
MTRFYLTTAIDYANGDPHVGHALEKIGADAIARYHRLRGDDVWFLVGMDEHGQKVAQTAAERGLTPQELVDEVAASFRGMWDRLGISYDQFIRTTDERHKRGVRALIERMLQRRPDDFYEQRYEGWYCVGCELFKRDHEIENGHCILHPTRQLQWTEERNWFFRLTKYERFLIELHESRPDFLQPESRRNEVMSLLASGLEDISITRSHLSWAIPFPLPSSTGEDQGTWVWFDALPNYLTATGYPDPGYESRWPAQLHVIGKDITRLHCVVWPAMLESAGLPLPERVWAHGFVSFGGERLSKSAGVRVELADAVARFGPDAFRYFLMREVAFDGDGGFSWDRFEERYVSDLANAFGNLASRTIAMIERYCGGVVPPWKPTEMERGLSESYAAWREAMDGQLIHEALRAVWRSVAEANEYVDRQAPWKLAKDPDQRGELEATMATLARYLAVQAILVSPVMPVAAQALWAQLGGPARVEGTRLGDRGPAGADPSGWRVTRGDPLFPKDQNEPGPTRRPAPATD